MITKRFRITFLDEILATTPGNEEIYADFIASKALDYKTIKTHVEDPKDPEQVKAYKAEAKANTDEEKEALHETLEQEAATELEKGTTFFFKDEEGQPYIYSYWLSGYFKSACSALRHVKGTLSSKLSAHKKKIDLLVKPFPDASDKASRKIKLENYGTLGMCERPLRASTAQGERVALSRSESAPAGTQIEFDIVLLDDSMEDILTEWMDYGVYNGLGQWRNSGKGAFTYEILNVETA